MLLLVQRWNEWILLSVKWPYNNFSSFFLCFVAFSLSLSIVSSLHTDTLNILPSRPFNCL